MIHLLARVCFVFFKIGLFTLGGGLAVVPLLKEELAQRGWMTSQQFLDVFAIAQSTPGPIGFNTATFVGFKIFERTGSGFLVAALAALAATLAIIAPSVIGAGLCGGWFERNRNVPWVARIFSVLRPLVSGIVCGAGIALAWECFNGAGGARAAVVNVAIASICCAITVSRKFSPLWGLGLGAVAGAVGYFI